MRKSLQPKVAIYNVVTHRNHFKTYLKDAQRLLIEVRDGDDFLIGYGALSRLERAVEYGGLQQTSDIVDPNGQILGEMTCFVTFDSVGSSSESSRVGSPDEQRTPHKSWPTYRPPNRKSSPIVLKSKRHKSEEKKVTFADLEEALVRSKEILAKRERKQKQLVAEEQEKKLTQPQEPLPTWNLSTRRLKTVAEINQFQVDIKRLTLKPESMDTILNFNSDSFLSKTKRLGQKRPLEATKNLSYFVSYSVPPERSVQSFCGSKKARRLKKSVVHFEDAISRHNLKFDTKGLDIWWVSNLVFKVYLRSLNQKTPTLLGTASIGMKHLLMDEEFSEGVKDLKLPVYATESLKNYAAGKISEIIGDFTASFSLKHEETSKAEIVVETAEKEDFSTANEILGTAIELPKEPPMKPTCEPPTVNRKLPKQVSTPTEAVPSKTQKSDSVQTSNLSTRQFVITLSTESKRRKRLRIEFFKWT